MAYKVESTLNYSGDNLSDLQTVWNNEKGYEAEAKIYEYLGVSDSSVANFRTLTQQYLNDSLIHIGQGGYIKQVIGGNTRTTYFVNDQVYNEVNTLFNDSSISEIKAIYDDGIIISSVITNIEPDEIP